MTRTTTSDDAGIAAPLEQGGAVPYGDIALFLVGTFAFAWILWGYWVVAMPPGGLIISPAFIACAIIGGFAPSLAAIAVSAFRGGRAGVAALFATARRPVAWRYVLLALIVMPAATAVSCVVQVLAGMQLRWPDPALLAMGLVWPIMAALGEEFGWRAFLTARLAPAWGLLPSALAIGLVWGLWHLPADYIALKAYDDWFWLAFLINGPFVLTAHSIIMSWLWQITGRSTLVALLYHWSITSTAIVAPAAAAEGSTGLWSAAIGAFAVWAAAIGLLAVRWKDFAPRQAPVPA